MAVAYINEPYVRVHENIRENPPLLDIDGSSNIGGVIVSNAGPRLAFVSGPRKFLELYTIDGKIPRNADRSFINAYYMSFSAGLVLARSMNTTAVGGIYLAAKKQNSKKVFIQIPDESLWSVVSGGKLYFHNGEDKTPENFVEKVKALLNDKKKPLYSQAKIEAIQALTSTAVYIKDIYELCSLLSVADSRSYSYSEQMGGIVGIPDAPQFTKAADENATVGFEFYTAENIESTYTFESKSMKFKDNVALTNEVELTLNISDPTQFSFVYGSLAFYKGPVDKLLYKDYSLIRIEDVQDIATSINGIPGMAAKTDPAGTKITINYSDGNELPVGIAMFNRNCNPTLGEPKDLLEGFDWDLGIYPKDPQGRDAYLARIYPDDISRGLFRLGMVDILGKEFSYVVSLDPDAIDESGNNAYIDNLNAVSTGFTFITNNKGEYEDNGYPTPNSTQVFSFGNSGLSLSQSKTTMAKIQALYALEDQELYDIEYLAPFGEVNLQWVKHYVTLGRKNDWFTPVDIPHDRTNFNSIKSYFLNVDLTSNAMALGPFDKNTGLTGWLNLIAGSTLYYTRVMQNKAARAEFAPCFEITNGVLDYTHPMYMLGKEDREKLLNFKAPVNFLVYDQRLSLYYLNDNRTHQEKINIVSEEQNRRMVNKIKKDCKRLMRQFKGRTNTETTRNDVRSLLDIYFRTQLMGQKYPPVDYEIVCDESNNSKELIVANKLAVIVKVKLINAIKFIDVLVDVFPLTVDFNA